MQLVTRSEWGAPAETPAADMPTAQGVKVHWIGGDYSTPDHSQCAAEVRAIRQEHLDNPTEHWVDIAYNFCICGHGYVFEARGLRKESGANGNQELNRSHYAVCAIVGIHETDSAALLNGLRDAIDYLRANGAGPQILAHKDGYPTDCPGDTLYSWVHSGAPRPGVPAGPPPAPTPAPSPAGPSWPGEYLRLQQPMEHDGNVRTWQQKLADRGWSITVDGWYGNQSAAICRQFQAECNAEGWSVGPVDGVVGPRTWDMTWRKPIT